MVGKNGETFLETKGIVKLYKYHKRRSALGLLTTYNYSSWGSFITGKQENCQRFSWLER